MRFFGSSAILLSTFLVALTVSDVNAQGRRGGGFSRGQIRIGIGSPGLSFGYYGNGFSIGIGSPSLYYGRPYPMYSRSAYYVAPYGVPSRYSYTPRRYAEPRSDTTPSPSTYRDQPEVLTIVPVNSKALEFQHRTEQAFRVGHYDEAARMLDHAILEDFENGVLRLFQSQLRFALGDYTGAVESLDEGVLQVTKSNRGFVVQNYRHLYKGRAYVEQMDRLVQYGKENPLAAYAKVLRAYHYLYLGHEEAAQTLLEKAAITLQEGGVGSTLLAVLREDLDIESDSPPPEPLPNTEELPPASTGEASTEAG